jgi:hypothetical protein
VTVLTDSLQKHSGAKAAHFHGKVTANDSAYMIAQAAPLFPVASDTLYVRFMLYVQKYPNASTMHTRLAWVGTTAALNNNANGQGYAMETYNGIGIERISSGHYRDTSQRMTDAANTGKWLCWEFEIDNKGGPPPGVQGAALTHLWREGTELKLAVKGGESENWGAITFGLLNFSLFAYQTADEVADFWIDDVAMNTKRIGCP